MGKMIADNQALFEGRNNYVEQLAKDLQAEFPDIKGFSKRNIFISGNSIFFMQEVQCSNLLH